MLVSMTTHISGTRDGVEWPQVGGVIDVPDREAADLIANGYAKAHREVPAEDLDDQDTPSIEEWMASHDATEIAEMVDQMLEVGDPTIHDIRYGIGELIRVETEGENRQDVLDALAEKLPPDPAAVEKLPPADDTPKVAEGTGEPMTAIEVPADGTQVTLNGEGSDVGDQINEAGSDDAGDPASTEGPEATDAGSEAAGDPGDQEPVNLDGLDKAGLLAFADEHSIEVNRNLGETKLRAQILAARG